MPCATLGPSAAWRWGAKHLLLDELPVSPQRDRSPASGEQFDVDCACAAFPAQVAIAAGLLATNPAMKTILLVGVDIIHRLSDPADPGIFLWGDGAGAAVIEAGDREGFIGAAFQADG